MASMYIPDDTDNEDNDGRSDTSNHSAVLIGSEDENEEVIDVEAVSQNDTHSQRIDQFRVIGSGSTPLSPLVIPDEDDESTTDYGSETEDESENVRNNAELSNTANRSAAESLISPSRTTPLGSVSLAEHIFSANEPGFSGAQLGTSAVTSNVSPLIFGPERSDVAALGQGNRTVTADSSTNSDILTSVNTRQGLHSAPLLAETLTTHQPSPGTTLATMVQINSPVRTSGQLNSSVAEFRSPKRRRIESPQKKADSSVEVDEESECCPICFEQWTNSGGHRLVALKCGHLFGQSCIERWLKGQGGKCPQCNAKSVRKDIRVIYAKALRSMDTSERDRALKELDKEKQARQKIELELAQFRLRYQVLYQETESLRSTVNEQRKQLQELRTGTLQSMDLQTQPSAAAASSSSLSVTQSSGCYVFDRTIKVWEAGNCRVMTYSPHLATLVVSQPSATPLFPGFGVKKLNCVDFKTNQYVSVHSKQIRDLSFNTRSSDGLLLSCSMDKTLKITSLTSNATVQSYQCTMPLWSCVWNTDDRNYFYAGQQNGVVCVFDIRNTSEHVKLLNTEGSRSPVVSLQYVSRNPNAVFRTGGLIVGQLERILFYESKPDGEYIPNVLPSDGSVASLSLEEKTRHIMTSYRPNTKYPKVRHQLCELSHSAFGGSENQVCTSNAVQTFQAGNTMKQLTRSKLLHHPSQNGQLLVCAPDEASCSVLIWDCSSGLLKQKLLTHQPVIDICAINVNDSEYLAALTDKAVRLYKWS